MFRVQRTDNDDVVFAISGRLDCANVVELSAILEHESSGQHLVLDLKDLQLVDRDAVRFLGASEADRRISIRNCPAYIRAWMARERG